MFKHVVMIVGLVCTLLVFEALAQDPQPHPDPMSTLANQVESSSRMLQSRAVYTVGQDMADIFPMNELGMRFLTDTFTTTVDLTINPITITEQVDNLTSLNLFYEISATANNKPVEPSQYYIVVAFFDPDLLPVGASLNNVALYYQDDFGNWHKEPTSQLRQSASTGNYYIGAYPDHFSRWGVFVQTDFTSYLPSIYHNYCGNPFNYTESARYNMVKINARTVWDQTDCESLGRNVVVAVVDTGVDLQHPELQGQLVQGQSFVSGYSSPDDDQGHGTHVAGIIAAASNGGEIMGVAPQAKIMPIKVLAADGYGSIADIAAGIIWAADNGADIINMSLGGTSNEQVQLDAVNHAHARGAFLVAASGNCGDETIVSGFPSYWWNGCSILDQTSYPAAYDVVMAVASTNQVDQQSIFSTQGFYVEVAAPGSDIISSFPYNLSSNFVPGYEEMGGTSQAAPHVAGVAAVMLSRNPWLSNQDIRNILRWTAVDVESFGYDIQTGSGRIDMLAAINMASPASAQLASNNAAMQPLTNSNPPTVQVDTPADTPFVPGELLIKRKPGVTLADLFQAANIQARSIQRTSSLPAIQMERLNIPVGQEILYAEQLEATGLLEYATPNYLMQIR